MSLSSNSHIQQQRQTYACSVNERIRLLCGQNPPQLAWAEPSIRFYQHEGQLRAGRHPSFVPLVVGKPAWPDDLALFEARLFWAGHAVHLLALDPVNCAEVTLSESNGDEANEGNQVIKQSHTLLTLRDQARFGLTNIKLPPKLTAIEYRHQGRVMAWRLTLTAANGANNHV